MDYSFNLFQPHREKVPKTDNPIVELRTNGRIVFNKRASELLNNHQYCMLGYDCKNNAVGLLPLAEQKTNAFPVRYASKGAYIGAKKFFKHFEILPPDAIETAPFTSGDYIGIQL